MNAAEQRLEDEIRGLLAATRAANEQYASADYGRTSGLNHRLSAIEEALVRLAQALDERP